MTADILSVDDLTACVSNILGCSLNKAQIRPPIGLELCPGAQAAKIAQAKVQLIDIIKDLTLKPHIAGTPPPLGPHPTDIISKLSMKIADLSKFCLRSFRDRETSI